MKKRKRAYLNYAYGTKAPRIRNKSISNPRELFRKIRNSFCSHFGCRVTDVRFAQNVSTHIVQMVSAVKKTHPTARVLVDSHEVPWVMESLDNGRLMHENMTYPNYAAMKKASFPRTDVEALDPDEFARNVGTFVDKKRPSIIVLSHISRLTGKQYPIKEIYDKMKEINPDSILIVDGAQVAGAMKYAVAGACDAYVTTTSKFVGAEPLISMAYLSPQFRSRHVSRYPGIKQADFGREAHSAVQRFSDRVYAGDFEEKIRKTRAYALEKIQPIRGVTVRYARGQAPHILTLDVGGRARALEVVEKLKKERVDVFHNMNWSIVEPRIPMVRISISPKTTKSEIDALVAGLKKVLK